MEIENITRYTELAVGLKPSALQSEARLRGLARAVGLKPSALQGEARLRGRDVARAG